MLEISNVKNLKFSGSELIFIQFGCCVGLEFVF